MATTTTNYALVKPDLADNVDIADINGNMDTIDTTMKSISDAASSGGGYTKSFLLMGA